MGKRKKETTMPLWTNINKRWIEVATHRRLPPKPALGERLLDRSPSGVFEKPLATRF